MHDTVLPVYGTVRHSVLLRHCHLLRTAPPRGQTKQTGHKATAAVETAPKVEEYSRKDPANARRCRYSFTVPQGTYSIPPYDQPTQLLTNLVSPSLYHRPYEARLVAPPIPQSQCVLEECCRTP